VKAVVLADRHAAGYNRPGFERTLLKAAERTAVQLR
jgi:hypothetical protein